MPGHSLTCKRSNTLEGACGLMQLAPTVHLLNRSYRVGAIVESKGISRLTHCGFARNDMKKTPLAREFRILWIHWPFWHLPGGWRLRGTRSLNVYYETEQYITKRRFCQGWSELFGLNKPFYWSQLGAGLPVIGIEEPRNFGLACKIISRNALTRESISRSSQYPSLR